MAAPDASASVLAWSWIIESLAISPVADLDTLNGLIRSVPNLSANLGKEAREMLALRCLEGLYDPDKRFGGNDSSSLDKKGFEFGFDSCQSFGLVLKRVLDQTSLMILEKGGFDALENLRKGASNELVREVCAFVERRKAGLPKCALEQMRCRLKQKGGNSLATNMKQVNGPEVQDTITGKRNKHNRDISVSESPVCLKRGRSSLQTEMESDRLPSGNDLMHGGDDDVASTEQELAPFDDVELFEDASRTNKVPQTAQEVQMEGREIQTLSNDNEGHVKSTSPKTCQLSEDASLKDVLRTEGGLPETAQVVQIEGTENGILSNAYVEPVKPTCPKTCQLSEDASLKDVLRTEGGLPETAQVVQIEGTENGILSNAYVEPVKPTYPKTCQLSENASLKDVLRTEGGLPETAQVVQIEGTEKGILSNAYVEPVKPTCPQTSELSDVCLMCKKGGKLLTCASSCRMVIHERCLGFSARLDRKGDFFCPPCAHSHALAKFAEAKNKMLLAWEELSLFVSSNPVPCKLDQPMGKLTSVETTSKDKESVEPAIPSEAVPSKQTGASPVDNASKDKKHEDHLMPGNVDSAPTGSFKEGEDVTALVEKVHHRKVKRKLHIEDFHDSGLHKRKSKQQRGPSKNSGTAEAKYFEKKPSRNCPRSLAEQTLPNQMMDALSSSLGDHDGASEDKICKDTTSRYSLRYQMKQKPAGMKDAYSASHNNSDGTSGEENCRATSTYSLRNLGKRISVPVATPISPLERRIRLNWTQEEVEMLKEGVKRFGPRDMKYIPWNTIFDFGSSVFWKGRTPVDLKDKWRNLVRSAQTPS